LRRMNGYGSHWSDHASELRMIQKTTTIDWPMMYFGVPKKRAARSAPRPNASLPKAPRRWSSSAW